MTSSALLRRGSLHATWWYSSINAAAPREQEARLTIYLDKGTRTGSFRATVFPVFFSSVGARDLGSRLARLWLLEPRAAGKPDSTFH